MKIDNKHRWFWLSFGLLLSLGIPAMSYAQGGQEGSFPAERWEAEIERLEVNLEEVRKGETTSPKESTEEDKSKEPSPLRTRFFQLLAIIIGVVLLSLIGFYLFKQGGFKSQKQRKRRPDSLNIQGTIISEEFPSNPKTMDEEAAQAALTKNYAEAIRLYFQSTLLQLHRKRLILWEKDKTNSTYWTELRPTPLGKNFRFLSQYFNHSFYGKEPISEKDFQVFFRAFQEMQRQIKAWKG